MVGRRNGYGRERTSNGSAALAELIPGGPEAAPGEARIRQIPIEEIRPNPVQPRKSFHPEKLQELVASIRANGIIQPVLVRAARGGFELIAGERRYRAACMAGLKEIPAIQQTVDNDADLLELALIENLQREDLNPIEEAEAYQNLLQQHGYTQERLSRKLGRARVTVTNALRLLKLPAEVQEAVVSEVITTGHGKALLGVDDADDTRELLRIVVERGLNVRQTEELVRRHLDPDGGEPSPPAPREVPIQLQRLSERLCDYLGTRVTIVERSGGGGRIVVDYNDGEELDRIVDVIEREF